MFKNVLFWSQKSPKNIGINLFKELLDPLVSYWHFNYHLIQFIIKLIQFGNAPARRGVGWGSVGQNHNHVPPNIWRAAKRPHHRLGFSLNNMQRLVDGTVIIFSLVNIDQSWITGKVLTIQAVNNGLDIYILLLYWLQEKVPFLQLVWWHFFIFHLDRECRVILVRYILHQSKCTICRVLKWKHIFMKKLC